MKYLWFRTYQQIIYFSEHRDHQPWSPRSAEGSEVPSGTCGSSWEPTERLPWEVAKAEFECNCGDWMKSLKLLYINVLENVVYIFLNFLSFEDYRKRYWFTNIYTFKKIYILKMCVFYMVLMLSWLFTKWILILLSLLNTWNILKALVTKICM